MTQASEPKWIQQIYKFDTGEDFLGLRSVQANITQFLLPGIITTTSRARYYSFYSWLLYEYESGHSQGMPLSQFIKRREQIFALANFVFNETNEYGNGRAGLVGTDKIRAHIWKYKGRKNIPLSVDDYVNASRGGFDTHYGAMQSLGIFQNSEDIEGGLDLLPKSKKLSDGFRKSIQGTQYYQDRYDYDTAKTIPYHILLEYGEKCYLSALAKSPDGPEIVEILFGFDAESTFHGPESTLPIYGNMGGTLGMMLDIFDQATHPFDDRIFRDCIFYGGCPDFTDYMPSKQFEAVLSHWRMFQLREYYVYALYELWIIFLNVLRERGPFSFDTFRKYIDEEVHLSDAGKLIGLKFPKKPLSKFGIEEILEAILSQSNIKIADFEQRCLKYSKQHNVNTNEKKLESILLTPEDNSRETRLAVSFLLLASVYLRLRGIQANDPAKSWYWAKEGDFRHRSMALFVQQVNVNISENKTLLQTLEWLFRDYIIAQHTITAIEKWQQRNTNTFHFKYDNGIYEWIKTNWNGYSGSRFTEAYSMLRDLGLVTRNEEMVPKLTPLGQKVLKRVKEKVDA